MKTSETLTGSRYESITTTRMDNTQKSLLDQRENLEGIMEMPNQVREKWTFIGKVFFGKSHEGTLE